MDQNEKKLIIRNSTIDFLIFTTENDNENIEVILENENIWLPQKLITRLFDVDVRTVNEHLKNIFTQKELSEDSTVRNFRIVQI